ncbi:MAG: type I restriction endonuclease subunit S [Flavobacterium psychrophilum]|nr:MAG: type I restriction endonuclease subunit S [Flavobacterium psychrophilum]
MQELLKPKKGWEVKRLGDVLKVRHGKDQKQIIDKNGKYLILGTGGPMGFTNHFLYDKESVLIGRKGTIDKPKFIDEPFWTVDTLFYTEISNDNFPKFIFYRFQLIDWYSYNEASGVPSLSAKTIENISIHVPQTKDEQIKIAQVISDMDIEIESLESKLQKYRQIKSGMMQNLLTGKMRLV